MGVEPYLAPTFTVPEDILDGLTEDERNEGLSLFVQVTAIPQDSQGEDDIELGLKRVPVSDAATPNHNPAIDHLLIDGVEVDAGVTVEVTGNQTYAFEPILSDDSIEPYQYLTLDGGWEERVEEPYFSIYIEQGSVDAVNTLYPYSDFEWTAPLDPSDPAMTLWIVVQDRRGGMSWWSQDILVR